MAKTRYSNIKIYDLELDLERDGKVLTIAALEKLYLLMTTSKNERIQIDAAKIILSKTLPKNKTISYITEAENHGIPILDWEAK